MRSIASRFARRSLNPFQSIGGTRRMFARQHERATLWGNWIFATNKSRPTGQEQLGPEA